VSTPSLPVTDGTDLLTQEIREETSRLVSHPIEEVKRLEHVAAAGESAVTPLLVTLGVLLFFAGVFAVFVTAAMLVYYLV
jgi:hypothetical protein